MAEGSITVLVLEDETAHAELMRRAFESHGDRFNLEVLGSLAEARNYLSRGKPDLVIADLMRGHDEFGMNYITAYRSQFPEED